MRTSRTRLAAFGLGLAVSTVSTVSGQAVWWRTRLLTERPGACLAYDAARARIVLFGGQARSASDETWEWDGSNWSQRDTPVAPPGRTLAAMTYDAARQRTVLFGGASGGSAFGDTWEWDGSIWSKRTVSPAPPARFAHGLSYDSVRRRTVLFGGSPSMFAQLDPDTWEWDGNAWTRIPSANILPRSSPGMAFDAARGRTVLFGGDIIPGQLQTGPHADTWEWDGQAWTQRAPAQSPPRRTAFQGLIYDGLRQRIVLFGGSDRTAAVPTLTDTWEWDGANWQQRSIPPLPTPVLNGVVYYAARLEAVLLGTADQFTPIETWAWIGAAWSSRARPTLPAVRQGHALVTDLQRGRVLLFGGSTNGVGVSDETWEWDGAAWRALTSSSRPPPRQGHEMSYDSARGEAVVFGGVPAPTATQLLSDTWVWNGTTWLARTTLTGPSARYDAAMTYDPTRQRTVLFGGYDGKGVVFGDTWEWDGAAWTQRFPAASPAPRRMNAMAFDPIRQRVLMVGGDTTTTNPNLETWEWDGTTWTLLPPVVAHAKDGLHAVCHDATRGRLVLHSQITAYAQRTLEWNGTSWILVGGEPLTSFRVALAFDPVLKRTLLLAGDTWIYGDRVAAGTTAFGTACAGSNGMPQLTGGLAYFGNPSCGIEARSLPGNAPLAFGLAATTQTIVLGGGCSLYVPSGVFLPTTSTPFGTSILGLNVPVVAAWRGALVHAQAFVVDAGGAFAGLAFTQGLTIVVGD